MYVFHLRGEGEKFIPLYANKVIRGAQKVALASFSTPPRRKRGITNLRQAQFCFCPSAENYV